MRRFLLIDTASEPAVVAIATQRSVLAEASVADRRQLSEQLLSRIDELSREARQPLDGLAAIGIVSGPGPFTALRIGTAVANALAYANRTPLVPAAAGETPSLTAFAALVLERLKQGKTVRAVLPTYGREPSITPPKESGRRSPDRPSGRAPQGTAAKPDSARGRTPH
ncbi:MAG: tRNA (adenosine(37)-N6)-threonylcarbamoyltransferase complex dimerization subunit type 1 TsaB [bacterium]|nr:tRNA (adenosine(37)-N6)-threonylcarbamoyltransferase complex dimerization subunit type 1 TsaB [bacterium]